MRGNIPSFYWVYFVLIFLLWEFGSTPKHTLGSTCYHFYKACIFRVFHKTSCHLFLFLCFSIYSWQMLFCFCFLLYLDRFCVGKIFFWKCLLWILYMKFCLYHCYFCFLYLFYIRSIGLDIFPDKIFNRNTLKIGYSCTQNIGSIIKAQNKKNTTKR